MMDIVYIANARFPNGRAHGIQIAKMCEAFVKAGASVLLVVPSFGKRTLSVDDFTSFYGLSVPAGRFSIRTAWVPRLSRASRFGFLFSSFIFGITSVLSVAREKGTLYSIDLDYFSFFAVPFLRRPYFFEIHSAKKNTFFHRLLFKHIEGVVAINDNVRDALETAFPTLRGRVIVHPNGVDINAYRNMPSRSLSRPAVVYTGSFQDWKGLETVLAAARALPRTLFHLVGGDKETLGKAGTLPQNIFVYGRQPFTEMPSWQVSADVLLATGTRKDAYSSRYTSPMKLFEYCAAGKPIVAARTEAIRAILSSDCAFWYEPDDADSLARAITAAMKNSEEARAKISRSRVHASAHSWDSRAVAVLHFLKRYE